MPIEDKTYVDHLEYDRKTGIQQSYQNRVALVTQHLEHPSTWLLIRTVLPEFEWSEEEVDWYAER